MKILVTGANGYLGRGVVKQLLDNGHIVVATDFSLQNVDSRAISIECDIFSVSNPYCFFGEPDVLIHMAWKNGFIHNNVSHINDLPNHYKFLNQIFFGYLKSKMNILIIQEFRL